MGIIRETAEMSDTERMTARNSNFLYLLSVIYPVGSIYISTVSTSPSALFGGTWERIKDTFLLAAGNTYTAGATGGETTHTLTEAELPNISGGLFNFALQGIKDSIGVRGIFKQNTGSMWSGYATEGGQSDTRSDSVDFSFGSGQAHNNMPPYLAVYVWKRTA